MFREPKPGYAEVVELVEKLNLSYPAVSDIESQLRSLYERHKMEYRESVESQGLEWEDEKETIRGRDFSIIATPNTATRMGNIQGHKTASAG